MVLLDRAHVRPYVQSGLSAEGFHCCVCFPILLHMLNGLFRFTVSDSPFLKQLPQCDVVLVHCAFFSSTG